MEKIADQCGKTLRTTMRDRESFAGAKMVSPVCRIPMACRTLHLHFGTEKSQYILLRGFAPARSQDANGPDLVIF
jgi:hypothetical protein